MCSIQSINVKDYYGNDNGGVYQKLDLKIHGIYNATGQADK